MRSWILSVTTAAIFPAPGQLCGRYRRLHRPGVAPAQGGMHMQAQVYKRHYSYTAAEAGTGKRRHRRHLSGGTLFPLRHDGDSAGIFGQNVQAV